MKSEDNLWDTGKENHTSSSNSASDNSTLDLSEASPEIDQGEINLAVTEEKENPEKDVENDRQAETTHAGRLQEKLRLKLPVHTCTSLIS